MNSSSLYDIPTGRSAHILRVPGGDAMSRRLLDIGFTPGTSVTCLYKAPGGDPRAYLVRGAVIALRREDARAVEIEPDESPVLREVSAWA